MTIYYGSCHCGEVTFEFTSQAVSDEVYRCNCSLCQKKGILMKAEHKSAFKLISGESELLSYKWNKQIAEHFFCQICGVYTHHKRRRDPDQICVNYACLKNVPMLSEADIDTADGASHT